MSSLGEPVEHLSKSPARPPFRASIRRKVLRRRRAGDGMRGSSTSKSTLLAAAMLLAVGTLQALAGRGLAEARSAPASGSEGVRHGDPAWGSPHLHRDAAAAALADGEAPDLPCRPVDRPRHQAVVTPGQLPVQDRRPHRERRSPVPGARSTGRRSAERSSRGSSRPRARSPWSPSAAPPRATSTVAWSARTTARGAGATTPSASWATASTSTSSVSTRRRRRASSAPGGPAFVRDAPARAG